MNLWKRQETIPAPVQSKRVIGVPSVNELVGWGWQEKTVTEDHRDGSSTVKTVEYQLYSRRRCNGCAGEWYVQYGRDGFIEPIQHHSGDGDKHVPLGTVTRLNQPSGRYHPAPNDRCVRVDEWTGH